MTAAESRLRQSEHSRKMAEAEASTQQTKISQAESSLYGGSIRNPKELQDLQADLASLKKRLAMTEEQELDAMQGVETAEAELQAAESRMEQIQARLQQEHQKLIQERMELVKVLETLRAERDAAVGSIRAGLVAKYDSLRQEHRGVAVAEVKDNACAACGTTLTAALQQSARHADELTYCPSCGRILFAG